MTCASQFFRAQIFSSTFFRQQWWHPTCSTCRMTCLWRAVWCTLCSSMNGPALAAIRITQWLYMASVYCRDWAKQFSKTQRQNGGLEVFFFWWLYVVVWLPVQNLWHLGLWHHNIPDYLVTSWFADWTARFASPFQCTDVFVYLAPFWCSASMPLNWIR